MAPYAAAILLGAFLLFLVQPMAAKMLLPRLGGAPSVWTACMLFFQVTLLAGYAYGHLLTRRGLPGRQVLVHGIVLALPLAVLPLALPVAMAAPGSWPPVGWLLATLAWMVGLPFFALATTGPLFQRWFTETDHPRAKDPYFLYAVGNVGSLGALIAYPFAVEPRLPLQGGPGVSQTLLFSACYLVYLALAAWCGFRFWRQASRAALEPSTPAPSVGWRRGAWWVALAFVPSSAVLGVTQYLTTDIAVVPLLWVLPLSIYLLTFVLAFSTRLHVPPHVWNLLLGSLAVAAVGVYWIFFRPHLPLLVALHSLLLFAIGMVCHGRLAADRPPPSQLTAFYLLVALGGALGGAFNAIVAPRIFASVVEYPLVVLAACLVMEGTRRSRALDLAVPAAVAAAVFGMPWVVVQAGWSDPFRVFAAQAVFPCTLALFAVRRPLPLALSLAILFAGAYGQTRDKEARVFQERTFFGVLRVTERLERYSVVDERGRAGEVSVAYRTLHHGSTRHGVQVLDPRWRLTPTSYYHRSGPMGQVLGAPGLGERLDRVAVVGLGIGTLGAYGRDGRTFTFFELDPEVIRIARDPVYFTFLEDSTSRCTIVPGDGRLSLGGAPDGSFDLIVLDAFSSDAVPMHLLTQEAVSIYLAKLRPGGMLAFHLTNQNLDLEPVVGAIASNLGLAALAQTNPVSTPEEVVEAKDESTWAVVARNAADLAPLDADSRWHSLTERRVEKRYLWTDDTASLFGVLRSD